MNCIWTSLYCYIHEKSQLRIILGEWNTNHRHHRYILNTIGREIFCYPRISQSTENTSNVIFGNKFIQKKKRQKLSLFDQKVTNKNGGCFKQWICDRYLKKHRNVCVINTFNLIIQCCETPTIMFMETSSHHATMLESPRDGATAVPTSKQNRINHSSRDGEAAAATVGQHIHTTFIFTHLYTNDICLSCAHRLCRCSVSLCYMLTTE